MWVFAASTNQATSLLELLDRYGVAWCMLVLFIMASVYVLRRLLNEKTGILTGYVDSTNKQQRHLAETVRIQAETDTQVAACLEKSTERLDHLSKAMCHLENLHYNPHSQFATGTLVRCFHHGLSMLGHIATKLDIATECEPLIQLMQHELDQHNLAADRVPSNGAG